MSEQTVKPFLVRDSYGGDEEYFATYPEAHQFAEELVKQTTEDAATADGFPRPCDIEVLTVVKRWDYRVVKDGDARCGALVPVYENPALPSPGISLEEVEKAVRDEFTDAFVRCGFATPGMLQPIISRVMARLQPSTPTDTERGATE